MEWGRGNLCYVDLFLEKVYQLQSQALNSLDVQLFVVSERPTVRLRARGRCLSGRYFCLVRCRYRSSMAGSGRLIKVESFSVAPDSFIDHEFKSS